MFRKIVEKVLREIQESDSRAAKAQGIPTCISQYFTIFQNFCFQIHQLLKML